MRTVQAEVELMKQMVRDVFEIELTKVIIGDEVYVGVGEVEDDEGLIEIIIMRDNSTPKLTLMKSIEGVDVFVHVLEHEGRRYLVFMKFAKNHIL